MAKFKINDEVIYIYSKLTKVFGTITNIFDYNKFIMYSVYIPSKKNFILGIRNCFRASCQSE